MTDLKPCPFCGSSDVSMREITNYSNYAFKGIFCNGCKTFHVAWISDENRIESWNRRATGSKSLHDTMKKYREKCGEPVVDDRMVE